MALAGGYFVLVLAPRCRQLTAFGGLRVAALASAWPAIAVWAARASCSAAAAPDGHGVDVWRWPSWACCWPGMPAHLCLSLSCSFRWCLFGSARASAARSPASWVLTVLLVLVLPLPCPAALPSRHTWLSLPLSPLLTPVEWAGNLRKANSWRTASPPGPTPSRTPPQQRLLAERSAHDLALEQERQHMARELHDVISARLSAIALQSGAALHQRAALDGARHAALLRQIRHGECCRAGGTQYHDQAPAHRRLADMPAGSADLPSLVQQHQGAGTELCFQMPCTTPAATCRCPSRPRCTG